MTADKATFETVLRRGIFLSRQLVRRSENGRAYYVPNGWEVYDLAGKVLGKGHTEEAAIDKAFKRFETELFDNG